MEHAGWTRLKDGTDGEMVIAVDFPSRGAGAGMRELAPLLRVPFSIWQPWPPQRCGVLRVDTYLGSWLRYVEDHGLTVKGVLGWCGGAAVAGALAAQFARQAAAPALVLFDPDVADARTLHYQFTLAVNQIAVRSRDDTAELDRRALDICAGHDLPAVARALAAEFRSYGMRALPALGVDAQISEGICERFGQYCEYLAVAGLAGYDDVAAAVAVVSQQWEPLPVLSGPVCRTTANPTDLLVDPVAVRVASDAIMGARLDVH